MGRSRQERRREASARGLIGRHCESRAAGRHRAPTRANPVGAGGSEACVTAARACGCPRRGGGSRACGADPGRRGGRVACEESRSSGGRREVEQATELWLHAATIPPGDDLRTRYAVGEALFSAGEDDRARELLEETIETARAAGALGLLPSALHVLSLVELRRGRLAAAAEAAAEAHELARALAQTGERLTAVTALAWVESLLGREAECREHIREAGELKTRLGSETYSNVAEGMLELARGRFNEALQHFLTHAQEVDPRVEADAIAPRSFVPSLVEAAIRSGRGDEARDFLD